MYLASLFNLMVDAQPELSQKSKMEGFQTIAISFYYLNNFGSFPSWMICRKLNEALISLIKQFISEGSYAKFIRF